MADHEKKPDLERTVNELRRRLVNVERELTARAIADNTSSPVFSRYFEDTITFSGAPGDADHLDYGPYSPAPDEWDGKKSCVVEVYARFSGDFTPQTVTDTFSGAVSLATPTPATIDLPVLDGSNVAVTPAEHVTYDRDDGYVASTDVDRPAFPASADVILYTAESFVSAPAAYWDFKRWTATYDRMDSVLSVSAVHTFKAGIPLVFARLFETEDGNLTGDYTVKAVTYFRALS